MRFAQAGALFLSAALALHFALTTSWCWPAALVATTAAAVALALIAIELMARAHIGRLRDEHARAEPEMERKHVEALKAAEAVTSAIVEVLAAHGLRVRVEPPRSMMAHDLEGTMHLVDRPWESFAGEIERIGAEGVSVMVSAGEIVVCLAAGPAAGWPFARLVLRPVAFEQG